MTYAEIAKQCGYSDAASCHRAIMREMDRCVVEDVEQLRREELQSLDRLEQICWERLMEESYAKGKMFAVDRIIAIKERRAKLMGLDRGVSGNVVAAQVIIREAPPGVLEALKA